MINHPASQGSSLTMYCVGIVETQAVILSNNWASHVPPTLRPLPEPELSSFSINFFCRKITVFLRYRTWRKPTRWSLPNFCLTSCWGCRKTRSIRRRSDLNWMQWARFVTCRPSSGGFFVVVALWCYWLVYKHSSILWCWSANILN